MSFKFDHGQIVCLEGSMSSWLSKKPDKEDGVSFQPEYCGIITDTIHRYHSEKQPRCIFYKVITPFGNTLFYCEDDIVEVPKHWHLPLLKGGGVLPGFEKVLPKEVLRNFKRLYATLGD